MLSAEQLELITAAVDGELSTEESRALRRLLDTVPLARSLYTKLKADSDRVRAMTQVAPPADLVAKVMARVADATTLPPSAIPQPLPKPKPVLVATPVARAQPVAPARYRDLRALAPLALAASVLVAVTVGSYAYFSNDPAPRHQSAKHWTNVLPAEGTPAVPSPVPPREQPRPDPDAVVRNDMSPVPPVSPMPKEVLPGVVAVAPEPRPSHPDLIAAPVLPKLPPFDLVQVRLPFLRAVAELDRDDIRQELTDELGREPGFPHRFDLFVRNTARGVEVFQNAARAGGVKLFIDATTLDRLKKKQVQTVAIYTESMTAAELAEFFAKLTAEDQKFTPRVCDSLHATPANRADELDLKAVLGIDAGLFKRSAAGGAGQGTGAKKPATGDPKPVSAGTIGMVTDTLTSPAAKPVEKTAVLLTWQPGPARTQPSASAELKQFLAKRDRKPGAVPAIIVIRPAG